MPILNGYDTAIALQKNDETAQIPIIFITAKADVESITQGFDVGGVDYITKPFHEAELVARVKTHLKISHLSASLKLQADQMYELANTDPLTGIANRLKFNTILEHLIGSHKRYNNALSLVYFDIDHFKKVNDTYGHKIGDVILIELSKMVQLCIRDSDLFARWGGEEFIIVLPETNLDSAAILAEKIRACIENFSFDEDLKVTCSFGVAELNSEDDENSLLIRADSALYEAKESGRNKVVVKN